MRFLILMSIISFNCNNPVIKNTVLEQKKEATQPYIGEAPLPPPPLVVEVEDTTYLRGVYLKVDKPAVYKKGMEAFFKYAQDSTKNPICDDLEGTVYVSCVVEIDGVLSNIRIKKGIPCGWNEPAMRTLEKTSGDWICGFNKGKAVRSYMIVPIKCKIE